jgi:hypothetical protein
MDVNYGNSYSGKTASGGVATPPIETVNDVVNQMFNLADQVECGSRIIADSIAGSQPQPVSAPKGEGASPTLIDRLRVIRCILASADQNNGRTRGVLGI